MFDIQTVRLALQQAKHVSLEDLLRLMEVPEPGEQGLRMLMIVPHWEYMGSTIIGLLPSNDRSIIHAPHQYSSRFEIQSRPSQFIKRVHRDIDPSRWASDRTPSRPTSGLLVEGLTLESYETLVKILNTRKHFRDFLPSFKGIMEQRFQEPLTPIQFTVEPLVVPVDFS